MKNRISVYVGEPLSRLLSDESNVSGRLNEVADRYNNLLKKDAIELTEEERFLVKVALNGSVIDNIFIEYFEDEISDLEETLGKESLLKKLKNATFGQKLATIEDCRKAFSPSNS